MLRSWADTERLGYDMTTILAIDPGGKAGWALSRQGTIVAAGLVRVDLGHSLRVFAPVDLLVCEKPQCYPDDLVKGTKRANDLIVLAIRAGMLCEQARPGMAVTWFRAHDWKGSVPKDIHNARILTRMTTAERELLDCIPEILQNNTIDAIGLAMYASGRYRP